MNQLNVNTKSFLEKLSDHEAEQEFFRIIGAVDENKSSEQINSLKAAWFHTLLGPMITVSDEDAIYLLEFFECRGLPREIRGLKKNVKPHIIQGDSAPIRSIKKEVAQYFEGKLKKFQTPLVMTGTPFQKTVWRALQEIPYGETRSYRDLAVSLGKPTAFRAVARSNGANALSVIIPCHRVINTSGALGGYDGGLPRKEWMLALEKQHAVS